MQDQETRDGFPGPRFHPGAEPERAAAEPHEHRLDCLICRLPERWAAGVRWLRHPSARWARIPAGVLFIFGGFLFFLPILGLWMLPLGLILLAEDIPMLRRWRDSALEWLERRRPHWFDSPPRLDQQGRREHHEESR